MTSNLVVGSSSLPGGAGHGDIDTEAGPYVGPYVENGRQMDDDTQEAPADTPPPTTEIEPVTELGHALAYDDEPDVELDSDDYEPVVRRRWSSAVTLAAGILAITGALATAIYLVGRPADSSASSVVPVMPTQTVTVTSAPAPVAAVPPPPPVSVPSVLPQPPSSVVVRPQPPAPVAVAPPAAVAPPVKPPSRQQQLTDGLAERGFQSSDPAGMTGAARTVCSYMAGGASREQVAAAASSDVDQLSPGRTADVIDEVIAVYCPQYN